jgi:hypothetical protein
VGLAEAPRRKGGISLEDARAALAQKERWDSVLGRAVRDQEFRQRLMESPREVLVDAGIELNEIETITVREYDPRHVILTLPPMGAELAEVPMADRMPPPEMEPRRPNG